MADFWENAAGVKLACYSWPVDNAKFLIYLCHGYVEHANRYGPVVEAINKLGGSVFAHDHYGHGESGPYEKTDSKRYEIDQFSLTTKDVESRIKIVREANPNLPLTRVFKQF